MYFQRWLRDWFRVVLPHEGMVIGVVVLYLLTDVIQLFDAMAQQLRWGIPNQVALPRENGAGAVLAIMMAVLYGGFRVAYFHPFFRKDYREWLQRSPWRPGHRLPLGPVHIVGQDLVVLGVLALATLRMSHPVPWAVPFVFLLAYVTVAMFPLLFTGEAAIAFVIALLAGGIGRWATEPLAIGVLAAAMYGFCFLGLRRSLSRVHAWDLTWWHDQISDFLSRNMANLAESSRMKILGWPHDRLSLRRNETPVSFPVGLSLSVLTGWWLHALIHVFARPGFGPAAVPDAWVVAFGLTMPALFLAGIRTGIYVWGYAPPVGLLARLVRFQWIIPGYDKVFIPPVCVVTLALYGPHALSQIGIPWEFGVPLLAGLMALVALTMPPSLDQWRLTGRHRIVPAITQKTELMES